MVASFYGAALLVEKSWVGGRRGRTSASRPKCIAPDQQDHMKPSSITLSSLMLVLAVLTTGCIASSSVPKDWLPTADRAGHDVYGSWVEIVSDDLMRGELIAVTPDSLYYLPVILDASVPPMSLFPTAVARSDVEEVRVHWFDADWESILFWGLGGAVSTLSHGFFFLLSAPVWLISTAVSTRSRSLEPRLEYPDVGWMTLAPYARYPLGYPQSRSRLRPRPQTE